jgi:hypothetical protein
VGISVTGPAEVHAAILVSLSVDITDALAMVGAEGPGNDGLIYAAWTICPVCAEASPMKLPAPGRFPDRLASYVMLAPR